MATMLTTGLSLKPAHYEPALGCSAEGLWFEVHPENYMVMGGPRLAWLAAIRDRHPVSMHAVGLSLASSTASDAAHLARLAALVRRIEPALVSEHLAWCTRRGAYYPDLLPVPRTAATLASIAENISRTQDALGRRIAVENPAHYLVLARHEMDEIAFLQALVERTGCGLLVDVNNVYVAARNLGYSAHDYIDAFPAAPVMEIHLAGHTADPVYGESLLIDTHDAPIAPPVWNLYERLVHRIGPRPTLIERDDNIPDFSTLLAERARAEAVLRGPLVKAA